jgi:hypothetical protein
MPLSLIDFWKRLIQSGLVDTSAPRDWAAIYATEHQSKPPSDPLKLAQWLVQTGRLKHFQADCLLQDESSRVSKVGQNLPGRFPVMRIAPLTQAAEQAPTPFEKWLPVVHDAYPDWPGVALQINPTGLKPEDGDCLRWLAGLRRVGVPQFELMALPGAPMGTRSTSLPLHHVLDAVGLFAPLPNGAMLSVKLKQEPTKRWTAAEITPLIESMATAMASLASGPWLPPPMPSPDRIWMPQTRSKPPTLWLDPAEFLTPGVFEFPRSIASEESALLYCAPERLGSETPTRSTCQASSFECQAVYALGCLAYRLQTGQHAFAAAKDDQIRSRQLRYEPPELKAAVAKGAAGDPLLRVLAYALAKDPASRFASLDAFLQALRATHAAAAPVTPAKPQTVAAEQKPEVKSVLAPPTRPTSASTPPEPSPVKPVAAKPLVSKPAVANSPQATPRDPAKPRQVTTAEPRREQTQQPDTTANAIASGAAAPAAVAPTAVAPTAVTPTVMAPTALAPTVIAQTAIAPEADGAEADELPPQRGRRPSRRRTAWYVLGSLWIPIVLLIVALALQDPDTAQPVAKRTRPPIPAVIPSVTGSRSASTQPQPRPTPIPPKTTPKTGIEVVSDDRMLWAPPAAMSATQNETSTATLTATMLLPPGPAALTTFDLQNLIAIGLRETFDPEVSPLFENLQKRIAVPLDEVRLVAMAWFPGRDGVPEIALAVHLKSPRPLDELTEAWNVAEAQVPGGVTVYAGDEVDADAYYPHFASDDSATEKQVDAFAVGSIARITQVAEVEGAAVLLPRQLEELWESAQSTDAVAMLAVPNFLIADARTWVDKTAPTLLDWIRSTLTPECAGLLIRITSADADAKSTEANSSGSYLEVRLAAASGMDPQALKSKVLGRVQSAPLTAEDFLVSREVDPSWRLLASRLPTMWAFTSEQIRSAAVRSEVIFNAYLPPKALPQLTLGTLLAANTTAMTAVAGPAPTSETLTLEQMLNRPMTVSFGQESLQFAVDTIINEFAADLPEGNVAPKVEIIGGDLQLMGITQNQQVRNFSKKDVPLRTVLTDLVLGANPDRTATGPNDPKQALIWVVVGEGKDAEIKVTTREAAKNKYTLPKEFQLP